jgi:hypothetical protein
MTAVPIISVLKNPDLLLAALGHDPHFHDAEVISLRLDRDGRREWEGPVLFVEIHLFDGRRDPHAPGGVVWFNHKRVTFRFANVALLDIHGFNGQNAIFDLLVAETEMQGPDFDLSAPRYRVEFVQSFGIGASFICKEIEVEQILDGAPPGSVYSEERPGESA